MESPFLFNFCWFCSDVEYWRKVVTILARAQEGVLPDIEVLSCYLKLAS